MQIVGVSVEVKKMLSDGEYGHESAQVAYTAELEDGEDQAEATAVLLQRARAMCLSALLESESLTVRRKVKTPRRVCNHCQLELDDDIRGYLHPTCDAALRAERDAIRDGQPAVSSLEELPF